MVPTQLVRLAHRGSARALRSALVVALLGGFAALALVPSAGAVGSAPAAVWRQQDARQAAQASADELAVFFRPEAAVDAAARDALAARLGALGGPLEGSNAAVLFVRLAPGDMTAAARSAAATLADDPDVSAVSPVYYQAGPSPETRMALTGEVVVRFRARAMVAERARLASAAGLAQPRSVPGIPHAVVLRAPSALASLAAAAQLQAEPAVVSAAPDWYHARATRSVPDDPLFGDQWHLLNTGQQGGVAGQDIDVTPVWDTYRGSPSQVIAIVDDGLQIAHPDLSPNIVPGLSWDYVGNDPDPSPGAYDDHGTSCAGVAAARGFNGIGVSGAAPDAGLVGFRMLGADSDSIEGAALARSLNAVDIASCSWGPADDRHLEGPGPLAAAAIENGVTNGRGGRGRIYVWAAGNGRQAHDNANFDGYVNSRFTIAVAACDNRGVQSYYSEPGADLMVTAPSSGNAAGITTTDVTGSRGYSSGDYTDSFGGTSSAAPLVAGVVDLMLQANPDLTWRDVQAILMTTAQKNDPADADWTTNGAGYHIDHKYGFGRVDAQAAVAAAATWVRPGPDTSSQASATPNVAIPDNDAGGVSSSVAISDDLSVEYVDVTLTAPHQFWSDLQVELVSPDGTVSVVAQPSSTVGGTQGYANWRFGTARCFGESSQGTWSLHVSDHRAGNTGSFQSWTLTVHGHPNGPWADTTAPVTTASVADGAWTSSSLVVRLDAFDPDSAVDHTTFDLDGLGWTTGTQVTIAAPGDHSNDGLHTLQYRSYDSGAGPSESVRQLTVGVDTLGPVAHASRTAFVRRGAVATLRLRVDDATSPQADVTIVVTKARGRTVKTLALGRQLTGVGLTATFRCHLRPGSYRFVVYADDLAGNVQTHIGVNHLRVR